jgi:hypothetical protein
MMPGLRHRAKVNDGQCAPGYGREEMSETKGERILNRLWLVLTSIWAALAIITALVGGLLLWLWLGGCC